jgi:hypothetical protein
MVNPHGGVMRDIIKVSPTHFFLKDYSPLLSMLKAFNFDLYDLISTYHTAYSMIKNIGATTSSGSGDKIILNIYPQNRIDDTYRKWYDAVLAIQNVSHNPLLFDKDDAIGFIEITWGLLWVKTKKAKQWLISAGYTQHLSLPELYPLTESADTDKSFAAVQKNATKKYKRGVISASAAATILGVSERQVRRWDDGENMPEGYPGRGNEIYFRIFAGKWTQQKLLTAQAREMNRPSSGGGLAESVIATKRGGKRDWAADD